MEVEPSPSVRRAREMLEDPHRYYADARARASADVTWTRRGAPRPATGEPEQVVYGVHAVRAREICATQLVTADVSAAEAYAQVMSQDPSVLAAAVTRYILDHEGRQRSVALFVDGTRQTVPHVSDDRRIFANGHGDASDWAPK